MHNTECENKDNEISPRDYHFITENNLSKITYTKSQQISSCSGTACVTHRVRETHIRQVAFEHVATTATAHQSNMNKTE